MLHRLTPSLRRGCSGTDTPSHQVYMVPYKLYLTYLKCRLHLNRTGERSLSSCRNMLGCISSYNLLFQAS